jgi:hypothetical protein
VSLPWRYNLGDGETFPVHVYREHEEWERHSRWFNLPLPLLSELYVTTYDCDRPEHLDWIEAEHPGHVFVY